MPVIRVEELGDRRLEDYRNVRDPELLRRRGLFMAEGRLVVERLLQLDGKSHSVQSILVSPASFAGLEPRLAARPDLPIYLCSTEELASIVGFNLHRGCLALASRPPDRDPTGVMAHGDVVLVLEDVADADNIGSAFRNAAAFGAGGVLLSPACCDPLYRKAIRTSMGGVFDMPYARLRDWPKDLWELKHRGFALVALTPREPAIDLADFTRRQPRPRLALLVGAEGRGLTAEAEALADVRVRIPMKPGVDSLNLATATGIALYHLSV
jgi:tRNA G18 (ribose-2'-O)-methylase SpoU